MTEPQLINLEYELEKYNLSCIHRIMCKWDCTALKCPHHSPYTSAEQVLDAKRLYLGKVAGFLQWLHGRNGVILAKYVADVDRSEVLIPLRHDEIEKLMSQYSGTKLTITTPMSEEETCENLV